MGEKLRLAEGTRHTTQTRGAGEGGYKEEKKTTVCEVFKVWTYVC
jgi:hypothetical protein